MVVVLWAGVGICGVFLSGLLKNGVWCPALVKKMQKMADFCGFLWLFAVFYVFFVKKGQMCVYV